MSKGEKGMFIPAISNQEHSCVTCAWFGFNPDKPKLNRECLYKGSIKLEDGMCQCWKDTRTLKQRLLRRKVKKAFC